MMMCMRKLISANRLMTLIILSAAGFAIGYTAAKIVIDKCCCANQLKSKAKRAFKAIEEKMMG